MDKFKKFLKNSNKIEKIFVIIVQLIILLGVSDIVKYNHQTDNVTTNQKQELLANDVNNTEVNNVDKDNNDEKDNDVKSENEEVDSEKDTSNKTKEDIINEDNSDEKDTSINSTSENVKAEENRPNKQETIYFNKSIKGRGSSDEGRTEPNYTGLYGYAVVYYGTDVRKLSLNSPWIIPTYKKIDYDHYEVNGELPHKTVVKVISQNLTHEGYGRYDGYLTVTIPENGDEEYLIDVSNFITNDYWDFPSVKDSASWGYSIAEYHQNSDKLPVYVDNDIANVKDGAKVIIKGKTGTYGSGRVDDDLRQVEAYYFNENREESTVFFNEYDLKIVY